VLAQDLGELETVPARGEITIQHLLTHTSGISYRFVAAPGPTQTIAELYRDAGISDGLAQTPGRIADLGEKLGGIPILFDPGSDYSYSLSVDVLGRLVEIVSGSTLAEFFASRIFEPLGMVDTHFFLDAGDVERLASIYTPRDGGGIRELGDDPIDEGYLVYSASYPYSGPRTYFSGGAGLTSTAADYVRFLQMFLNGGELDGVRLLGPKTVQMMTRNSIGDIDVAPGIKFGLGFAVVEDPGLAGDVRSKGTYYWGGFFNTRYFVDPSEELIGIFMSQRYPQGPDRLRDRVSSVIYQAIVD
jgi:CubicO group peptidase (beta-lactamase class C family)